MVAAGGDVRCRQIGRRAACRAGENEAAGGEAVVGEVEGGQGAQGGEVGGQLPEQIAAQVQFDVGPE